MKLAEIRSIVSGRLGISPFGEIRQKPPLTCGDAKSKSEQIVCDEIYEGSRHSQTDFKSTWKLDTKNCAESAKNPNWGQLITVIIFPRVPFENSMQIQESFAKTYPGLSIVQASLTYPNPSSNKEIRLFQVQGRDTGWQALINSVKTPYVLVGRDLRSISESANLERSLRLLQDPRIGVVSGATRNLTGHWHTDCLQSNIVNYDLYLKPGYEESSCDCMKCAVSDNAPFMTKTEIFTDLPLNTDLGQKAMFLDWFLRVQKSSLETIICPDIMYNTFNSHRTIATLSQNEWLNLAPLHFFQGVVLNHAPRVSHTFSCDQAGLSCNARAQQRQALLLPWCCQKSFSLIMSHLEDLSVKLNFHYEVDAGTALGGVKLGHYIPWDIDADIFIPTKAIEHFKDGGKGKEVMEKAGISVYSHSKDNYGDKGAGFFMLWHEGIEVEMLGRKGGLLTLTHEGVSWNDYDRII